MSEGKDSLLIAAKFIQIAVTPAPENYHAKLYALDEDGVVWVLARTEGAEWERIHTGGTIDKVEG